MKNIKNEELLQIMIMRAMGYNNREIATEMNYTERTIRWHLRKLHEKAEIEGYRVLFNKLMKELV